MMSAPTESSRRNSPRFGGNGKIGVAAALFLAAVLALAVTEGNAKAVPQDMALIPSGSYMPFMPQRASKAEAPSPVRVEAFWMDVYPVTNRQFQAFVQATPRWRKSRVKALFADQHYLDHWTSDLTWDDAQIDTAPVTNISWFAARAYCEANQKKLPTTDQWEYALADQGRDSGRNTEKALAWYSAANPSQLPSVGATEKNGFGVYALIGLVWEWTLDYNSFMVSPELRSPGGKNQGMFCGAGSQGVKDPTDYAAFMRYSLRTSLRADYTTNNLGFRCVQETL